MSMIGHTGRSSSSTSSRPPSGPSLKLLVGRGQSGTERVVCAEGYKDAIDFLFSLLSLPISMVVNILTRHPVEGCVGTLYRSVETFPNDHICNRDARAALLRPTASSHRRSSSGFVIGGVTYKVMDDLEITPPSDITAGITMLNIRGTVREMTVHLGEDEAVKILSRSLVSQTVLTDVFIPARRSRRALTPA